ncbi:MAG: alpha-N-arabinofuranosidase, partial [Alphaproteobacteria bacterium]|nr:alpha-N-arabinofuranosidase [Alphaproteobacteria bacterium]
LQAEVTSCGLNGGPLKGKGKYEARIACNLWSKEGVGRYDGANPRKRLEAHPYFTQSGKDRMENGDQYIANMRDGAVAGFKYFEFQDTKRIAVTIRGNGKGRVLVSTKPDFSYIAADIPIFANGTDAVFEADIQISTGVQPLYFRFTGSGSVDFKCFELH